jgi:hypothetical protein
MDNQTFEQMLTGGHPNSLGRTVEVVELVLAQPRRMDELYGCYRSADEVVRLRTSSAFKRISLVQPELLVPYIDRLLSEIAALDQASAQWTLAHLYATLRPFMTPEQHRRAVAVLQHNLDHHDDWIVLNMTMQTLADWSAEDEALRAWLRPRLHRLTEDRRKSVAGRARKLLKAVR